MSSGSAGRSMGDEEVLADPHPPRTGLSTHLSRAMQVSLRARLTAWYSLLLVLTLAVFSAAVLWLHWQLLLEQFDEGLTSVTATAGNVVEEELNETDLPSAAAEMVAVVRVPDGRVQVLDASGKPIAPTGQIMPLPPDVAAVVSRG